MRKTSTIGLLVALFAAALTFSGCTTTTSDRDVTRAPLADVTRWSDDSRTVFVDVRPQAEFEAGHIPRALNLDLPNLDDRATMAKLKSFRRVVVYGDNPGSARPVAFAKRLIQKGIKGGVILDEGLDGWKGRGLPVVASP